MEKVSFKRLTVAYLILFTVLCPRQIFGSEETTYRPFEIRTDCSYSASLFYLIDNLSGAPGNETRPYYRTFWERQFGVSKEDEDQLAVYAAIRESYRLDILRSEYHLADKWPLLFVENNSLEKAWEKADLYLADQDVAKLKEIFNYFDSKFRPYWNEHAANLSRAASDFEKAGWSDKIMEFLSQAAHFYELAPSLKRSYTITLLWHPGLKISNDMEHSTRVGRLMLIELPEEQNIEEQVDVMTHELIHDLYEYIPAEARKKMILQMQKESPNTVFIFLQNMNEGFATALANGLFVARYLPKEFKPDGIWYASKIVDSFAKAVYPTVRRAIDEGMTLSGCGPLWNAAIQALADQSKLSDQFKSHVLIVDAQTHPLVNIFLGALDANDVHSFTPDEQSGTRDRIRQLMEQNPARPVVLMGEPDSLPKLLAEIAEGSVDSRQAADLKKKAKRRGLAALISRSGRPFLFLLGSRESIESGIARLKDLDCCSSDFIVSLEDMKPVKDLNLIP